jgi:hypothetical protein
LLEYHEGEEPAVPFCVASSLCFEQLLRNSALPRFEHRLTPPSSDVQGPAQSPEAPAAEP